MIVEEPREHEPDWLLSFRRDVYSKEGEDGIVEKIFELIGEDSRWCIELGALTGSYGSNTAHLLKDKKWQGVMIEADPTYFELLQKEYANNDYVTCVNAFVSFEGNDSLDAILSRTAIPQTFDLLSLDIDGNDYHLWESLERYRPRVIIIEFNPTIPHKISFVQARDMSVQQGSSLRALVDLGKRKGYELVAANESNAFFVPAETLALFKMDNASFDRIHDNSAFITHFFQLYDGTVKIAGNAKLLWHGRPIDECKLQPLPRRKRFFPNRINTSATVRSIKYTVRKLPFYAFVQRVRKML